MRVSSPPSPHGPSPALRPAPCPVAPAALHDPLPLSVPGPCCLFLFGIPLSPVPGPCCPSPGPRGPCCLSPLRAARSSPGPASPPSHVLAARSYPDPRSLSFLPGPCCPLLPGPRGPGALLQRSGPCHLSSLPCFPPGLLCAPVDPVHHGHAQVRHAAHGVTVAKMILPRKAEKENSRLPARQTRSCSNLCFVFSAL